MSTAMDPTSAPGPFAQAAATYWRAGWPGILPLPPRRKANPPSGWTGGKAPWPSFADLQSWLEGGESAGNVALRMPEHVIGVDVDDYADRDGHQKNGGATLAALEGKLGPLPSTYRSTSRDDGISGIRLFRVPEGLRWPGDLGNGIEIIQLRHRYVVAAPSIHPEGRTYRWITPEGATALPDVVPNIDDLPDLPGAWVQHLTGGQSAADIPRIDVDDARALAWLTHGSVPTPCHVVQRVIDRAASDLAGHASARHDIAMNATARLARLHGEGHHGVLAAMSVIYGTWHAALGTSRDQREAGAEWGRLVTGGVAIAAAENAVPQGVDPCDWPVLLISPPATPAVELTLAPTGEAGDDTTAPARATWSRVDLAPYLDGTHQAAEPTLMPRSDGVCLVYPGLVHSFHGESESGKSWIAQAECARLIAEGQNVLYVDFESDPASIVDRLRLLGADTGEIAERLDYRQPEARPASEHEIAAWHDMLAGTYALAVIDGVTDSLGLFGSRSNDNDEIATWMRTFPRQLARRTGAAVMLIDHVTKDAESRGRFALGGQAKMAGLDGAGYVVDVVEVLGKGLRGILTIRVGKDRPGQVRGNSGPMRKTDRTQEAARFVLDSTGEKLTWELRPYLFLESASAGGEQHRFRPTGLMERASIWLEDPVNEGASGRRFSAGVGGKRAAALEALEVLVAESYVRRESNGRGEAHFLVRPYRQADDPRSDRFTGLPTLTMPRQPVPIQDELPVNTPIPTDTHRFPTGSREPVGSGLMTGSRFPSPKGEPEPVPVPDHDRNHPYRFPITCPCGRGIELHSKGQWADCDRCGSKWHKWGNGGLSACPCAGSET